MDVKRTKLELESAAVVLAQTGRSLAMVPLLEGTIDLPSIPLPFIRNERVLAYSPGLPTRFFSRLVFYLALALC